MSLLELSRRSALRVAGAALIGLLASACLRPLHGPTASGEPLKDVLAAVQIEPVAASQSNRDRVGHYLRSELIFEFDGSGEPAPKRYRLTTQLADGLTAPLVDAVTGRAATAIYVTNVTYVLYGPNGNAITSGIATASASYDRTAQRFATVRAARDSEIRAAKELARQIKTRVAAALVSPPDTAGPGGATVAVPPPATTSPLGSPNRQTNTLIPGL